MIHRPERKKAKFWKNVEIDKAAQNDNESYLLEYANFKYFYKKHMSIEDLIPENYFV